MYCPEGFLTLLDVRSQYLDIAHKESLRRDFSVPPPSGSGFDIDTGASIETFTNAYATWLFFRFLEAQSGAIYVTRPEGVTLRLSCAALDMEKIYDGDFPEDEVEQDSLIQHLSDPFFFIDPVLLVFDDQPDEEKLEIFSLQQEARILRPFKLMPLCWKLPASSLTKDYLLLIARAPMVEAARKLGRTAKVPTVKASYHKLFPEGHGQTALKTVAQHVREDTGLIFELDTLKRAIGRKK